MARLGYTCPLLCENLGLTLIADADGMLVAAQAPIGKAKHGISEI